MKGKGFFLWVVPEVLKGDPVALATLLKTAGIRRIEVKVCEGKYRYKISPLVSPGWGDNVKAEWLAALRQNWDGEVWGWGFCYGAEPEAEGEAGATEAERLDLDGYIFDVETRFESQPDPVGRGTRMVQRFKAKSQKPTAWCSWSIFTNPYPSSPSYGSPWHNAALAKAGMALCDFALPMVYWPNSGAYWARFWLDKAIEQWRKFTDKSIIPAGRAYTGDGGTVTPEGVVAFGARTRELGLPGETWWSLYHCLGQTTSWAAFCNLPPMGVVAPPPPPTSIEEWRRQVTIWARGHGYAGPD